MKKLMIVSLFLIGSLYATSIEWYEDMAQAKKDAAVSGKKVMLMYTRPDCGMCRYMKAHVFTNEAVSSFIDQHFVAVEIDLDLDDALSGHKIVGTPTFYFYNTQGLIVDRVVGGGKATLFLQKLREVAQK